MTDFLKELEAVVDIMNDPVRYSDEVGYAAAEYIRTHHAEIAESVKLARGEREETWEIWQEEMCVAGSNSLREAEHYMAVYGQDGPVKLVRVVSYREMITPEQLDAMHNSAREAG